MDEYTKTSEKIDKIVPAIIQVMDNISGYCQRTGKNTFHGYNYLTETDLIEKIRPHLITAGLCYMPMVRETHTRMRTNTKGKEFAITSMLVEYTLYHTSGQWISSCIQGQGEDEGDKGGYKAMTGASKYFLHKAFVIATGDDPERQEEPPPKPKVTTKPTPPSPPTDTPLDPMEPANDTFTGDDNIRVSPGASQQVQDKVESHKPPVKRPRYKFTSTEVTAIYTKAKDSGINDELFKFICMEVGIKGWSKGIGSTQLKNLEEGIDLEISDSTYSNKWSENNKEQVDA